MLSRLFIFIVKIDASLEYANYNLENIAESEIAKFNDINSTNSESSSDGSSTDSCFSEPCKLINPKQLKYFDEMSCLFKEYKDTPGFDNIIEKYLNSSFPNIGNSQKYKKEF